jgi:hypothetical protein
MRAIVVVGALALALGVAWRAEAVAPASHATSIDATAPLSLGPARGSIVLRGDGWRARLRWRSDGARTSVAVGIARD